MNQISAMRDPFAVVLLSIIVGGFLAVCCATSASAYTEPHKASDRELRAEKYGRIVDADTGAGVSDVKVIVNWKTSSTGIPGYSSTGGIWCDLQKIVTTNVDGNYTIPDVSKELDTSDRGTRFGKTAFGFASATHDKTYALTVFKVGYVGVSDWNVVQELDAGVRKNLFDWPGTPDVSLRQGKIVIKPIAMRKIDFTPEQWGYYTFISTSGTCSDRMANTIEKPELAEIRSEMRNVVRPMACTLPGDSIISPKAFNAFRYLSHTSNTENKFYEKVKASQGLPPSAQGYDPTERISTTAGILCRVLQEEDAPK